MIKLFEEICDNFTDKEYHFTVDSKYINSILNMINSSTAHRKLFDKNKIITNNMEIYSTIDEKNNIIYNIRINLKKSEWTNLLSQCSLLNYQLIVKEDKDIMCFTKKETK